MNYINKNFYDLFPNQLKEKLINNFKNEILYSKQKKSNNRNNKNIKNEILALKDENEIKKRIFRK